VKKTQKIKKKKKKKKKKKRSAAAYAKTMLLVLEGELASGVRYLDNFNISLTVN